VYHGPLRSQCKKAADSSPALESAHPTGTAHSSTITCPSRPARRGFYLGEHQFSWPGSSLISVEGTGDAKLDHRG
jgi:hypothetical protein